MPSFTTITALTAVLTVISASPVERRDTFRVDQQLKGTYRKIGAVQVAKTYQKYGAAVPDNVRQAAAAAQSGTVTAEPGDQYDSLYLTPVSVGGTTLMLDFDTGSADLWCFSSLMPSSETSGHAIYTPSSSGTKKNGYTWDISYGDGSGASGVVYSDKVVVGGVTATSQAVEAATSVSSQFSQDTDTDGLLGLAFSSINTVTPQSQKTFFDTVKSSLASPVFTVDLQYHAAGSYDFGYIDNSKYSGSLTYVNVNTANGFWEFTTTGYAVGAGSTINASIDSIADTGTTLLYLPPSVVKAYYQSVQGAGYSNSQGGYVFPCSASLPNFSLVIGGTKLTVPGKYINYSPVTSTTCYGGIQDNTGIGFSILGDIFLKAMFVVFDGSSTPRIGFAQQA